MYSVHDNSRRRVELAVYALTCQLRHKLHIYAKDEFVYMRATKFANFI